MTSDAEEYFARELVFFDDGFKDTLGDFYIIDECGIDLRKVHRGFTHDLRHVVEHGAEEWP